MKKEGLLELMRAKRKDPFKMRMLLQRFEMC